MIMSCTVSWSLDEAQCQMSLGDQVQMLVQLGGSTTFISVRPLYARTQDL